MFQSCLHRDPSECPIKIRTRLVLAAVISASVACGDTDAGSAHGAAPRAPEAVDEPQSDRQEAAGADDSGAVPSVDESSPGPAVGESQPPPETAGADQATAPPTALFVAAACAPDDGVFIDEDGVVYEGGCWATDEDWPIDQDWPFDEAWPFDGGQVVFAPAAPSTIVTYNLVGVPSGRCLDVAGKSTADAANIQLWGCSGAANQQFRFEPVGDGYYLIRNVGSGKCVDVAWASADAGANIQQYTCHGGPGQQWAVAAFANGQALISARVSGQVLDAYKHGTANGTNIIQWPVTGATNQLFYLRPL